MRHIIVGGIGVLSGVILFGFTLVAAAIYAMELSAIGYSGELGLYGSSLVEIGIAPMIISAVLFIFGLVFFYKAIDKEWKEKYLSADDEPSVPIEQEENHKQ